MTFKYMGYLETYINGVSLSSIFKDNGSSVYYHKKGDVATYRVIKKINGKFAGISKSFKTKLEAWNCLVQFEEQEEGI